MIIIEWLEENKKFKEADLYIAIDKKKILKFMENIIY